MCAVVPASPIDANSFPGLPPSLPLPSRQSDGGPGLPICFKQLAHEKVIMLIRACLSDLFPLRPYAMTWYVSAAPVTW